MVLRINPNRNISVIKRKWKELVRECHPDLYFAEGLTLEASLLASKPTFKN